jgi:hypothetical protein
VKKLSTLVSKNYSMAEEELPPIEYKDSEDGESEEEKDDNTIVLFDDVKDEEDLKKYENIINAPWYHMPSFTPFTPTPWMSTVRSDILNTIEEEMEFDGCFASRITPTYKAPPPWHILAKIEGHIPPDTPCEDWINVEQELERERRIFGFPSKYDPPTKEDKEMESEIYKWSRKNPGKTTFFKRLLETAKKELKDLPTVEEVD